MPYFIGYHVTFLVQPYDTASGPSCGLSLSLWVPASENQARLDTGQVKTVFLGSYSINKPKPNEPNFEGMHRRKETENQKFGSGPIMFW